MSQITVTLKTGPASAVTSLAITNVTDIDFNLSAQVLTIRSSDKAPKEFDMANAATVTYTIASGVSTVVISS